MAKKPLMRLLGGAILLALLISPVPPLVQAAPTADAVVGPPCGEAQFDAALATVQSTVAGGTITFQCGGPTTIAFTAIKLIDGNVVIDGGARGAITLSGDHSTGLFRVDFGALALVRLTLANAAASQQGALAVGPSGTLSLEDCALTNNQAIGRSGGGIDNSGTLTVTACTLDHNYADLLGGAIVNEANASAVISATTVVSNSAAVTGGGIHNLGQLTISNAYFAYNTALTSDGGGVWTGNYTAVDGSTFYSNSAPIGYGGGLYNQDTLKVMNSSVRANSARKGGGGLRSYLGATALFNVSVDANHVTSLAGAGGGVSIEQGTLDATEVTVSGNQAAGGGGISNLGGFANLTASTLRANTAIVTGGGLENEGGTANLANVTLAGNTALGGGGLYNYNATASLTNVTLAGNVAANTGGGISNSSFGSPHLNLTNVIVADNRVGGNCTFGKAPDTSQFNLSSDNTCGFSSGLGFDSMDARLAPLASYSGATLTQIPLPGSPAVDTGTNLGCPATDQRNRPRPVNGLCDIGAVERQLIDFSFFIHLPLLASW
jgi:hypothetical protein